MRMAAVIHPRPAPVTSTMLADHMNGAHAMPIPTPPRMIPTETTRSTVK